MKAPSGIPLEDVYKQHQNHDQNDLHNEDEIQNDKIEPEAKFSTQPSQKRLKEDIGDGNIARRKLANDSGQEQLMAPWSRTEALRRDRDITYGSVGSSALSRFEQVGHNDDLYAATDDGIGIGKFPIVTRGTSITSGPVQTRLSNGNTTVDQRQSGLTADQSTFGGQESQVNIEDGTNQYQPRPEDEELPDSVVSQCPQCGRKHNAVVVNGERKVPQKHSWLPRQKRWYGIAASYVVFAVIIIVLAILAFKKVTKRAANGLELLELIVDTFQPKDAVPILGSSLGVAEILLGTYFTRQENEAPEIKAVYEASNSRLCVRTKSGTVWLDKIRCIQGARHKQLTPLTIVDSLLGFSIGMLNDQGYLASINYISDGKNETWVRSTLENEKIKPDEKSMIASTTWRKGLAGWFNYMDAANQLREHGYDDFRFVRWRDSSGGALGKAQQGSSYGISKYVIGNAEVEEIIFQATNGALQGRKYVNGVWNKQEFSINGTQDEVELGASMTATTVLNNNGTSLILLVYVAANGWVTYQTRQARNMTDSGAFNTPRQLVQSDGRSDIGLSADGSSGIPRIYFFKNQKLMVLESDFEMKNWTTVEVSFS